MADRPLNDVPCVVCGRSLVEVNAHGNAKTCSSTCKVELKRILKRRWDHERRDRTPTNWETRKAADALCLQIKKYWRERGSAVKVWCETKPVRSNLTHYFPRTNMVNGLPAEKAHAIEKS